MQNRVMPYRRKRGFTLIEILIVVVIIGILAAILFPVFAKARESARRSSCQSNLKQIALGFAQYVQDHDGFYPQYSYEISGSGPNSGYFGWANVTQPYLKSLQILQCPSEKYPQNPYIKNIGEGHQYTWYDYTDYFYNRNFVFSYEPYGTFTLSFKPLHESQLASAALTVLLGDEGNRTQSLIDYELSGLLGASYQYTYDNNGEQTAQIEDTSAPKPYVRHLGGANYAFADGHVKWLKPATISRGSAGFEPQAVGWSPPLPSPTHNAMPPCKLTAPYTATLSPVDYFCD